MESGELFSLSGDSLSLMSSSLPTSNLFLHYPHTSWAKDSSLSQSGLSPCSAGGGLEKPHVCEVCSKRFAKREHLTKHLRIHKSDNKRYACDYCFKAFRDRYELVRHTRRHTGDFPHRCSECNKGFMRHERYLTHLRWHSGERPYQCTMCDKSFRDRSELNRHSRRHTGDLPYKCETCGKGFLRRGRYVTHVRIHTGEKPFVCGVCARGYRDKRELKKHQIAHNHSGLCDPIPPSPQGPNCSNNNGQLVLKQEGVPGKKGIDENHLLSKVPSHRARVHLLPSEPIPKAELPGLTHRPQQVEEEEAPPLNPATIPLPPSVAVALQLINEKVVAKQKAAAAAGRRKMVLLVTNTAAPSEHQGSNANILNLCPPLSLKAPQEDLEEENSPPPPLLYYVLPSGEGDERTTTIVNLPSSSPELIVPDHCNVSSAM